MRVSRRLAAIMVATVVVSACGGGGSSSDGAGGVKTGRGVDAASKTIRLGGLYDLSGPLAPLGVPWQAATEAAVGQINESDQLGDWKLELESRDHAYNPSNSVSMYEDIKRDVAMIALTMGTQPTAPLLPRFAQDDMVAFVGGGASSSKTSHTIWGFSNYRTEIARAVDHIVETAGDDARIALVKGNDDTGADVGDGFKAAVDRHKAEVAAEVVVEATTDDFTAVVAKIKDSGATHVVLGAGITQAAGVLSTAASSGLKPEAWYGMLPSYLDGVMYGSLPKEAWASNFLWVHSLPYWGEDRPGMAEFVKAYESSEANKKFPAPQTWALVGYLQMQQLAAILEKAIEDGDLTPKGIYKAAESVKQFDAGGLLLGPVDLLGEGQKVTRVLKPVPDEKSWEVVGESKELGF